MIYHIYPNNKSNLLIIRHINRYVIMICIIKLQLKVFYIAYCWKIIIYIAVVQNKNGKHII